ncbi:hypothetical protein GCM10023205_53310 [Yinghuangia aomiensis]|uniref:Uncharacterized protein n=1 Tax=Yinghuangia aomiensis TaxID=676205 RepID=A0ABP9HUV3_9ACTN
MLLSSSPMSPMAAESGNAGEGMQLRVVVSSPAAVVMPLSWLGRVVAAEAWSVATSVYLRPQ